MFEAGLRLGDTLTNDELRTLFKCGNMGGMRRSRQTGTLVIISDDTKCLYKDEWKNGVLHYTGMGKLGDQSLEGNQNGTLYYSTSNGIEVHLFEVMERAVYTYRGIVQLADEPYQSLQPDEEGQLRRVWIFPLKPVRELDEPEERARSQLSNRELERRSKRGGEREENEGNQSGGRGNFPWKKSICDAERVWGVCRILGIPRRKIRSRGDCSGGVEEGDKGRIGCRAGCEGATKDS